MTSYNYTQCFICQEPLSCRNQDNYDDKINVLNRFCVLACRHLGFRFPPSSDIIEPEKTIRNVDNCKENSFIKKKYQSLCDICAPKTTEFCELYSQLISLRLRLTEKTGQVVDLIDKGNWKHRNEMTQEFSKTFREKFLKSATQNSLNDLPHLKMERVDIRQIRPLEIQPERQIIDNIQDEDCNDDYDSVFILPDIVENEPEENKNLLLLTETDKVAFDSADGDLGRFEPQPPKEIAKSPQNILHLRRKRLPLKCRYCERTFPIRSSLIQHERVHTKETPFKCRFCELGFAQSGTRNIHERIHTGIRPYKCKICNRRFTTNANCRTHLRAVHKIVDGSSDFVEKTEAAEANRNQDGLEMEQLEPRKCSLCPKSFSRVSDLKVHFRSIHQMPKKNKAARIYKCNHCDLRFSQSSTRNRHEKTLHSDRDLRPYKCGICHRAFLKVSQCEKHQTLIHKMENFDIIQDMQILEEINKNQISIGDYDFFRCCLCPNRRRFERQSDLETHQEICHGNEKYDDTTTTEHDMEDDVNVVKAEHLEMS